MDKIWSWVDILLVTGQLRAWGKDLRMNPCRKQQGWYLLLLNPSRDAQISLNAFDSRIL